jgi:hypothetical protein
MATDGVPTSSATDVTPPIGTTPPQVLARRAAEGQRGAAWRLMLWIMDDDPRAVMAVSSSEDDRLAQHLLEFIAEGTWAGKPFVKPPALRTAHARTRLRTLFLPGSGMDPLRAARVLMPAARSKSLAIRETAIHILGLTGNRDALPILLEALRDPIPSTRLQAAKALGRIGDEAAVPALLAALNGADEQLGSQISAACVQIGSEAVPALIERSSSSSAWIRWHCIRALGEIGDRRALPTLIQALGDTDHSVAWAAAKGAVRYGRHAIGPLLRLLMTAETSRWLIETSSYILHDLSARDSRLKPYLDPMVQDMHGPAPRVATPLAAQKTLRQLTAEGIVEA